MLVRAGDAPLPRCSTGAAPAPDVPMVLYLGTWEVRAAGAQAFVGSRCCMPCFFCFLRGSLS